MKKLLSVFVSAILSISIATAHEPLPPTGTPNPCNIVVTGDFDSECFYSYKDDYFEEYPDLMIACKHSKVTYTAYAYTGTATVTEYIWEIFGDVSHTATGDYCIVNWSDDEWGMVVVSIVTSDGDTCTESHHVKLIDNPVANANTIPAYTVMPDGTKVIRVCEGMPVTFIDRSDAGNSDIAGIHWECSNSLAQPSSTPTYTIDDVYMPTVVTHRVYNNCGCYDEEVFYVEVLTGEILELECYGTVCDGAAVEYRATAPVCQEYHWYVEGGTLIGGQGTDSPIVQWDHPVNGYGVIGLDGYLCGVEACPALMSKRVPVIQDHLAIEGQACVCVGDAVVYSLPMLGATKYTWSISPTTGIDNSGMNNTNEIRILFLQAGTYTLNCSYQCEFLGCGPYDAEELTITVKPRLAIAGNDRICISNACNLHTSPAVSATWTAYDLGYHNAPVGNPATGTSFSQTFSHAGRYLITAENSSYCGPATFVLEVKDVPPAPTAADLDPANRHTACPYLGIALNGTPSEQNYNLVWAPTCSTASPQLFSGDSVTISYQSEVCDVRVYNYDRVLQCQSTDYYVHQVSALTAAPLNIPSPITACPGSVIDWTHGQIPDQRSESMLYEWSIETNKQYCTSVQGSHLTPGITLTVNDVTTPNSFYMTLRRTFCGGSVDTTINISILGGIAETLSIAGPDQVCVGSSASYTGSGGHPDTYIWETDGTTRTGNPVSHTFMSEGSRTVTLFSNPFTYCTNNNHFNSAIKTVTVIPLPTVYGVDENAGTVYVLPTSMSAPAYSFYWTFRATVNSTELYLGNTPTVPLGSQGTYSCTVTDNSTGCSRTVRKVLPEINGCDTIILSATAYDACTRTLTLSSPQYPTNVIWNVSGGDYSIDYSGTNNRQADITFEDIGTYYITARTGFNHCYKGQYLKTVDFIPDFEFEQVCGDITIINRSRYVTPGSTVYMTVTNDCNNSVDVVSMPVNHTEHTYTPSVSVPAGGTCTYYFHLSGYGTNSNITPACDLGDITVTMPSAPSGSPITITSANPYYSDRTCDNTPIELTATLNVAGASIVSTDWNFGDGSSYHTVGNTICHTFRQKAPQYNVSVTITDNRGCTWISSTPFVINSYNNPISGGLLFSQGSEPCPFVGSRNVWFNKPFTSNHYEWWRHKAPTHVPGGYTFTTYQSDDYFTYVINDNYCQAEATTFVKFKNAPTARIYTENSNCCVGNEVKLYGETGPGSDPVTYSWSVAGLTTTGNDADFAFTPTSAGTYTVTLTVTNCSTYCSSTATTTITAHPKPAAPTLAFVGSSCISDAPVELTATGCSGEVHWSNGTTGSTAYYFTPGVVKAYCFDPAVGCNSDTANRTIIRQPDLDALPTGCYEKCKEQSSGYIPLYGLAAFMQRIWYSWDYPGGIIANYYTNDGHPLLLPYSLGDHYLTASAPDPSCPRTSSVLRISEKEMCDCDSVEVTCTTVPIIVDCNVTYNVEVTVCNRSKTRYFCIDKLDVLYPQGNVQIIYDGLTGGTVAPTDYDEFLMTLQITSLIPSDLIIQLTDNECSSCTKVFTIDLMPDINCTSEMDASLIGIDGDLSSDVAVYFDFSATFTPGQNLLAFWTEPPMVVNYSYDNIYGTLTGLGMIDMATLERLVAEDSSLCFYAIVCINNQLCKEKICIPANELYELIKRSRIQPETATGRPVTTGGSPQLKPNPATDEVYVAGTTDKVVEVLIMDMLGREINSFSQTSNFNISTLSAGMYIVRVKTRHDDTSPENVTYLKLVKK